MEWQTVIGLEIHTQLATQSKIFSGASTVYGAEPNTQGSVVDLGLPGVLPVLNEEAVQKAVIFGMAIEVLIIIKLRLMGAFKQTTPKSHRIFCKATATVALTWFRTSQF